MRNLTNVEPYIKLHKITISLKYKCLNKGQMRTQNELQQISNYSTHLFQTFYLSVSIVADIM